MAMKHPKHRRIPRAFLKTKAFRNSNLEDKVILWVHLFEFVVIISLTVVAAAAAVFLPRVLPIDTIDMTDKQVEAVQEDEVEDVEVRAVGETTTLWDKKVWPRLD